MIVMNRLFEGFILFCLFSLSCTNHRARKNMLFKHNFQQGSADHLYNVSDILGKNPVLASEETFFAPKDSVKTDSQFQQPSAQNFLNPHLRSLETKKAQTDPQFPALSSNGGYSKEMLESRNVLDLLKIQTVAKGEKVVISFAQENIYIDPTISFINKYEILDYEILNSKKTKWHGYIAQLLGQIEKFKGFPNTIYYILPMFEGNHLILYKLGPEDKIPYDELPLAKRVGNLLAVPLLGYPVKYCIAEVIPDINERETGQYKPKCEGVKLEFAEYVELQERDKKIFNYTDKPDLFPRDFFTLKENEKKEYNWFYVRTIVKSPENKIVGHQLFQPANLVEFHPAPGKLDVLDASGYNIRSEDKLRTLFIPVEWIDYQIKRDSENLHSSFSEESKKNIYDENLRYFKIKFEDLVENEIEFSGEKTPKNIFITDNYFSFNVEITGKESGAYLIKYAFYKKPIDGSYVPKQWFEQDSTQFFPSFSEKRKYYENAAQFYSQEDHDRFLRTTRFNPKAKEIKWYFSKQTPKDDENQWVRSLGQLAVDLLNRAFQEAGRDSVDKIKITLDDSGADKEVGDIRYNILNLMVTEGLSNRGLLGLGPNVANPITGEVVSATANVWVSHVLSIYITIVRKYIRFQVYPPAWSLEPFSQKLSISLQKRINEKAPQCGDLPFQSLGVTPFMHERIESICPEVTGFIEEQKKNKLTYDPENPDLQDKDIIKSCAKKLAFLPILGVTLHEIQHGFAQRHFFSASVDTKNFYKDYSEIERIFGTLVSDKIKEIFGDINFVEGTKCHPHPPQYSSDMDYMDFHNPILFIPGKSDIAAFRFLYFDKVDLKEKTVCCPLRKEAGAVLEVPSGADKDPKNPQKSILQAAEAKGYSKEDLKNHKVLCGGEKIDEDYLAETNPKQPLCKKFDYGANPFEIVINNILRINNDTLMNGRNRYDSSWIIFKAGSQFVEMFNNGLGDLYKKWKQYRDELLNREGLSVEDYSFLNPGHIARYKEVIKEEKTQNLDFEMYYDIRRPLFDYFKRLLFMPVKHCIYKKWMGSEEFKAIALENILAEERGNYIEYPIDSRERVINCKSTVAENWAEGKGELVAEVGFFGEDRKYFLRAKRDRDTYDERSIFGIWPSIVGEGNPFFDIVIEPDFGDEYYRETRDYMLQGSDLNPYINGELIKDPDIPRDSAGQVHFDRILSYKIDKDISYQLSGWLGGNIGIFRKRLSVLESAVRRMQSHTADGEFELQFGWGFRRLVELGLTAESIESNSDYPFFVQSYQEYLNQRNLKPDYLADGEAQDTSFASFIKNHPASLYDSFKSSLIFIPYADSDDNLPAHLFRRVYEFRDCIEKQEKLGIFCDDIEDKRAYVKIILGHYYKEAIENQNREVAPSSFSPSNLGLRKGVER